MDKLRGVLKGTDANADYQEKLAKYKQRKQEFYSGLEQRIKEHNVRRKFFHGICDYWPKDQPPDWEFRVRGAKKRAGNKCEKCGQSSDLHVHHKLPRSQGGNHKPENLIYSLA